MAKLIEVNLNPDRGTLRNFGYIAFIGFGVLAAMAWTESFLFSFGLGGTKLTIFYFFAALACYCLIAGLIYPNANKPIFIGLTVITYPIGIVLSYAIMATLFFGVIGLIGLFMRILRYDPMSRKKKENTESYWVESRTSRPKSDYFKQF